MPKKVIPLLKSQKGMILSAILMVATFLTFIIFSVLILGSINVNRADLRITSSAAQYAAESAIDAAIAQLNANVASPGTNGTSLKLLDNSPYYKVYYSSTITGSGTQRTVTGVGKTYAPASSTTPKVTRRVQVSLNQTVSGNLLGLTIANFDLTMTGNNSFTGPKIFLAGKMQLIKSGSYSPWIKVGEVDIAGDDGTNQHCAIIGNASGGSPGSGSETFRNYTVAPYTNTALKLNNFHCGGGQITIAPQIVKTENTNVGSTPSITLPWINTLATTNYSRTSQFPSTTFSGAGTIPAYNMTTNPPSYACSTLGGSIAVTLAPGHYPDSSSGVLSSCTANSDVASAAANSGTVFLTSKHISLTGDVHIRGNLCSDTKPCQLNIKNATSPQRAVFIYVEGAIYADINSYVTDGGTNTYPVVLVSYSTNTNPSCAITATVNANNYALYAPYGDLCITGGNGTLAGIGAKNINVTGSTAVNIVTNPNGSVGGTATWTAQFYRKL